MRPSRRQSNRQSRSYSETGGVCLALTHPIPTQPIHTNPNPGAKHTQNGRKPERQTPFRSSFEALLVARENETMTGERAA